MRNLLLLLTLFYYAPLFSQNVSVAPQDHPFKKVIEWKGKGAILQSQSPKEYMNQINLTLVAENETEMWEQKFNPKIHDPFYLFSENTKYIYFLDNLDLVNNGRFTFNQVNSAGNTKSGTLDIGAKVKRFENFYDYNKFEFQDAAISDKALISQYRYYDKKGKEYHEFAMFMTHHNMTHYVVKLGHIDKKSIDDDLSGQWNYIGFSNEVIHFSWREEKTDILGYSVKGFSPKGELVADLFMVEPKNIIPFKNMGYGNAGKFYIEDEDKYGVETGLISLINEEYYLLSLQKDEGDNLLVLSNLVDDKWITINTTSVGEIDKKEDDVFLGSFPINEGITYRYKHNGKDDVGILLFEKGKAGKAEPFTEQIAYNPSRLLFDTQQNEFITEVLNGILTFDLTQFARGSGVTFMRK